MIFTSIGDLHLEAAEMPKALTDEVGEVSTIGDGSGASADTGSPYCGAGFRSSDI